MPRKLKTFITNLGFFELAVAAPSMKAALEVWGLSHNIFQHGFAKQTNDAKIVAAALTKPGVVLRRPVGTKGAFKEDADTPKAVSVRKATPAKAAPKKSAGAKRQPAKDKAALISLEKERKRRDRERAAEEAAENRAQEKQQRAIEKAQAELDEARQQHEDARAELSAARERQDRREQLQNDRWDNQREKLEMALERAKGS